MTKRTSQLESAILAGFAEGQTLQTVCRAHDVSRTAFLAWKAADPALARRYEVAQLLHAEALIDECLEIADDPASIAGGGETARYNRLRIDTRIKIARLHFKRHEEAMERRRREEDARAVEAAVADAGDAPSEPAGETPAKAAPPHPAGDAPAAPFRLGTAAGAREPERRYASG